MPGHYNTERTAADPGAHERNTGKKKKHKNRPAAHDIENPLPGTGSKYNPDGSKRELGVGWGK
tara:strand:- start:97 stop:285 length:189 start_codon:yes stop_codon:yes gene_type:complete